MVAVTIGQWLQKKFGMRVVDAKWTSPQQTETYDGGNLPPSYVFFVFGLLALAELGSASARGNEGRFALRLFGRCGLQVRFEG